MYFKVMKAKNGQYYFTLNANNHEPVAQSEMYVQKQSALHAIEVIKEGAGDAAVKDVSDEQK